jgi:hypothetical protein
MMMMKMRFGRLGLIYLQGYIPLNLEMENATTGIVVLRNSGKILKVNVV